MTNITESIVEEAALDWFRALQYDVINGSEIAPDRPSAERSKYNEVVLIGRLKNAIDRINPKVPHNAKEEAINKILGTESQNLFENNHAFHKMITDGVDIEFSVDDSIKHDKIWIVDFQNPNNNDWLVVNQFTVVENANRRLDMVVFINGIPIALIELKNVADERTSIINSYHQLQAYKKDISGIFVYNEILIISDGIQAKIGTLTADRDRFMPCSIVKDDRRTNVDL